MWKQEVGCGEDGFEGHEIRTRFPGELRKNASAVSCGRSSFRWRCELVRAMPTTESAGRNTSAPPCNTKSFEYPPWDSLIASNYATNATTCA